VRTDILQKQQYFSHASGPNPVRTWTIPLNPPASKQPVDDSNPSGGILQKPIDHFAGVSGDALSESPDFVEDIEENPALRAAATLRAMDRMRDAQLLLQSWRGGQWRSQGNPHAKDSEDGAPMGWHPQAIGYHHD
jgi:hypothetical protein